MTKDVFKEVVNALSASLGKPITPFSLVKISSSPDAPSHANKWLSWSEGSNSGTKRSMTKLFASRLSKMLLSQALLQQATQIWVDGLSLEEALFVDGLVSSLVRAPLAVIQCN